MSWLHFLVVTHWHPSCLRELRGAYVKGSVDLIDLSPPLRPEGDE